MYVCKFLSVNAVCAHHSTCVEVGDNLGVSPCLPPPWRQVLSLGFLNPRAGQLAHELPLSCLHIPPFHRRTGFAVSCAKSAFYLFWGFELMSSCLLENLAFTHCTPSPILFIDRIILICSFWSKHIYPMICEHRVESLTCLIFLLLAELSLEFPLVRLLCWKF